MHALNGQTVKIISVVVVEEVAAAPCAFETRCRIVNRPVGNLQVAPAAGLVLLCPRDVDHDEVGSNSPKCCSVSLGVEAWDVPGESLLPNPSKEGSLILIARLTAGE